MRIKRPLLPGFMSRFDSFLLLRNPEVWSARAHLVIFFGLIAIALVTLFSFVVPDDPRRESEAWIWSLMMALVSIIGLVFWVRYLLRFNVFKRFGATNPAQRIIAFLLYFISIAIIIFLPWIKAFVETIEANRAYSIQQIKKDVNAINAGVVQLEYENLDHSWEQDTVSLSGSASSTYSSHHTYLAEKEFYERLANADTVTWVNNSVFIEYSVPDYLLLDPYLSGEKDSTVFNSHDIYNRYIRNYRKPDHAALKKEVDRLIAPYYTEEYPYYYEEGTIATIKKRYSLHIVENSMDNIMERKTRWDDGYIAFVRVHFYFTLAFALLLFTFRHSTQRAFFLALLAAVIMLLFSFLFMTSYRNSFSVNELLIVYFLVTSVLAAMIFFRSSRDLVTGIGLNLFVWMLPFAPLLAINKYLSDNRTFKSYWEEGNMILLAEITGMIIFLVFLVTFIHIAYRKWFAAPLKG